MYLKKSIPCQSTLRKNYVDKIYDCESDKIKSFLKHIYLWVSMDETTDIGGRYVANFMVGVLDKNEDVSKRKFLLNAIELKKANHETIVRAFNDSIDLLGKDFDKNKIPLFLTDAAPYMVKSANVLKIFYPKLIHVTCLVHGLHRVAEEIRSQFNNIDLLISLGKKIFLKAPSRVAIFKEMYPLLSLPPQPVLTRWGTWLGAVEYYAKNFDQFKNVVEKLDDADAFAIKNIKEILNLSNIKSEIAFIFSNYGLISETITKLEGFSSLKTQVKVLDVAENKINNAEGE